MSVPGVIWNVPACNISSTPDILGRTASARINEPFLFEVVSSLADRSPDWIVNIARSRGASRVPMEASFRLGQPCR